LHRVIARLNLSTCAKWCFAIPSTGTLLVSEYSDDIASLDAIGKIKRNRSIYPDQDGRDGLVRVNLGCSLRVEKGRLNIDGGLCAMFASWSAATQ
jgi:hypothetical protein